MLALPVFAVLAIFSVKYRRLTLDALDCLFRTVQLKKCDTGLDQKIKASLTGKVFKFSPSLGGFFYKHYKIISWVILILFIWSFFTGSVGLYNYIQYGNCNGPGSTGICIFDPTGEHSGISECEDLEIDTHEGKNITLPILKDDDPIIGPEGAELTVIWFGCYSCKYTKIAEPIVKEVIEHYNGRVNFQFKTFFLPSHELSYESSLAADCAQEQGRYFEYHDKLFENQEELNAVTLVRLASDIGLDVQQFEACMRSEKYKSEVEGDTLMGINAGIPGTPTFFVNGQKIVGPKPAKTFIKIIDDELEHSQ